MDNITIKNNLPAKWQPTKSDIEKLKQEFIAPVINGTMNVQDAAPTIIALIEALEQAYEFIKPQLLEWVQSFPKGQKASSLGVTFETKEAGARYDYSQCGDTYLAKLLQQKAELDTLVKERQDLIRKIKGSEFLVDKDTGEFNEVFPPSKKSTTSIIKTIPE